MNNHSLLTELSFYSVDANDEDIVLDELFQLVQI